MNSRYEEWIKHVFDHDVSGSQSPQWYFKEGAPEFNASPVEITDLLALTFRKAGKDLLKFSDQKVDQGIWYLASSSGSNFMSALASPEAPLPKRLEAIENIFYLYSDCFAKRCAEILASFSEEGPPLNLSCYMFWDLCRFSGFEDMLESKETRDMVLKTFQKILTIEHRACREGALHGLGHAFYSCPEKVREIVDEFLGKTKLDDQLLIYAKNAKEGNVL